jgi:hypothetical protein
VGSYCEPGRGPFWRAYLPRSLAGASPGAHGAPPHDSGPKVPFPTPLPTTCSDSISPYVPTATCTPANRDADGQIKGSEGLHRGGARAESLGLNVMISRPPRLRERAASLRTSEVSSLTYPPLAPPLFSCLNFRAIPASAGVTRTGSSRAAIIRSAQTSSRPARRVCGR